MMHYVHIAIYLFQCKIEGFDPETGEPPAEETTAPKSSVGRKRKTVDGDPIDDKDLQTRGIYDYLRQGAKRVAVATYVDSQMFRAALESGAISPEQVKGSFRMIGIELNEAGGSDEELSFKNFHDLHGYLSSSMDHDKLGLYLEEMEETERQEMMYGDLSEDMKEYNLENERRHGQKFSKSRITKAPYMDDEGNWCAEVEYND